MTRPKYPTADQIVHWLEDWRWIDAEVIKTSQGRLGRVWIVENPETVLPRRFALKGFQPEAFAAAPEGDIRALFVRELSLWLDLPSHQNVLPALGLELVPSDAAYRDGHPDETTYPLVRMPYRDTSLEAWVDGARRPELSEVLAGLAQLANGLSWLYHQGIEGHGDLKPDNVLARDLREMFPKNVGRELPTWQVQVADLGWADIWRELEGPSSTRKAQRIYLAPERLDGEVVPIRSDIFSFGVVAAEVLTGKHPSGKSRQAVGKSEGTYAKWAAVGGWNTPIHAPGIPTSLVHACLAADPAARPLPMDIIDEIARCSRALVPFDLAALMASWAKYAEDSDLVGMRRWSTEEISRLGGDQLDLSVASLRSIYEKTPSVASMSACAEWVTAAISLGRCLLRRNRAGDRAGARAAAVKVLEFVLEHDTLDLRDELWRLPSGDLVVSDLAAWEVRVDLGRKALRILEATESNADGQDIASLKSRLSKLAAGSVRIPLLY